MGALHRSCPCPTAWIGKKLAALYDVWSMQMFPGNFRKQEKSIILKCRGLCTCFFVDCTTKAEISGQRRDNERGREGSRNGWRGAL